MVLVGAFMAVLDTTIVNVVLPSIAIGTRAPSADLEWIVSGYALTFGLSLVTAGRLGDRGPQHRRDLRLRAARLRNASRSAG